MRKEMRIKKDIMKDWIGVPYKKNSISKDGTDCAGFVIGFLKSLQEFYDIPLFEKLYIAYCNLEDITVSLNPKTCVDLSICIPGDILYIAINHIPHFMIYHSKGTVIHCTEKNGVILTRADHISALYKTFSRIEIQNLISDKS